MDLSVISLSDIQTNPATGRPPSYQQRVDEILGYATLADRTGLDVFALGEHHTLDFAVFSPPVVLAAATTRTSRIRLTSSNSASARRVKQACSSVRKWPSRARGKVGVGMAAQPAIPDGGRQPDQDK